MESSETSTPGDAPPSVPIDTIAKRIAALGSEFDGEVLVATRTLYRPHLDLTAPARELLDAPYGPHARHRLDVYLPEGACEAIVVFVHGGGFVAGDKNGDGAFYRNIGLWLARQGMAAVLPNYRLAPGDGWPAGAEDVQSALQWVEENRSVFGASSLPLVLWGQSAGASHVASWLFDEAARGGPAVPLDGVMLLSGFYMLEPSLPPGPQAYFGADASLYAQRAPLGHVRALSVPLWIGVAEFDPGWIGHHSYGMAQAVMRASGRSPDFYFFRGHNHVSTVQSLGTPQKSSADEILRFIRSVSRIKQ